VILPLLLAGALQAVVEPPSPPDLRFDLAPGDHLVFREVLDQEVVRGESEQAVHVEWSSHGLVTARTATGWVVGFSRVRATAELRRYREGGKSRLERERAGLAERLARRPRCFVEANRIDSRGREEFPWDALREWRSETLFALREIPSLPSASAAPDALGTALGFGVRAVGREDLQGDSCWRFESNGPEALRLRYWFSPSLGLVRRVELDASYLSPPDARVRERVTLELAERRRGESTDAWLSDPDLRAATLAALALTRAPTLAPVSLNALLASGDEQTVRRTLALGLLFDLRMPDAALGALTTNASVRVRELAAELRARGSAPVVAVEKSPGPVAAAGGPDDLGARGDCGADGEWAAAAERRRTRARFAAGTRLLFMSGARFQGWPFIVRIPDGYRGDRPLPLLIHLAGGPGRAFTAAHDARDAVAENGWIVAYPQASGAWWEDDAVAMLDALFDDLVSTFNVDLNRVYLAGFSNGATGALNYATLWPQRFAAVVSLMGAGKFAPGLHKPRLANLAALPVLFVHGQDDRVIDPSASVETVADLRRFVPESPVELRLLPGRGHDVRLADDQGLTLPFLARHTRNPFPRRVRLEVDDLSHPRRYWLEVLEKGDGTAEARAEIDDENVISLKCRNVRRLRLHLRAELFPRAGPVRVRLKGRELFAGPLSADCDRLLAAVKGAADPFLIATDRIDVDVKEEKAAPAAPEP
jgi:dienelactone hydrolase